MTISSIKAFFRKIPPLRLVFILVNLILVTLSAASALTLENISGAALTTTAAYRFQGESGQRFAQLSAFFPLGEGKSREDIWSFRQDLTSRFVEEALEAPEGGSLYLDAYSGQGEVTVATDHGTATLTAIGVGGEFFYFHPLRLRSGSYIAEDDLMDDLVVLDEALAWRLFGGTELTGLPLAINGQPFLVAGVVTLEEDFASGRADQQEGRLFLSYSALNRLRGDCAIDCYEIVLPDPISGYARTMVSEGFPKAETVEVSGRFAPDRLWTVLKSFGERSMKATPVVYPYWENALRLREDYAALALLLAILFALCPAVTLLVLFIRGAVKFWRWAGATIPARLSARHEMRLEKRYAKKHEGE